jgi:hypothetical protein
MFADRVRAKGISVEIDSLRDRFAYGPMSIAAAMGLCVKDWLAM